MTERTHGTELTRMDPYFHEDGEGGLNCRIITDDGTVYWRRISRKAALRIMATLALHVEKMG